MAWLISIKTGNEMKLPRESFSFWNTHRHRHTPLPSSHHSRFRASIQSFSCVSRSHPKREFISTQRWLAPSVFPCECWAGWAAAAAAVADDDEWNLFLRFPIFIFLLLLDFKHTHRRTARGDWTDRHLIFHFGRATTTTTDNGSYFPW